MLSSSKIPKVDGHDKDPVDKNPVPFIKNISVVLIEHSLFPYP